MTELQFPSSTFVFAAPDANGNYLPASQAGKKKVNGIARKVTWGDRTLNVELVFTKFVSKQSAEKAIEEHAEKIKALAEVFFNNENLQHLHLNKSSKLALSYKGGNKLKSKHSIIKELTYKKESLQARLKTMLTETEKKEALAELKKVSHALNLFKKEGIFQRLFGLFKDIFITDATVLKASDLTKQNGAPKSDQKDQPSATIKAAQEEPEASIQSSPNEKVNAVIEQVPAPVVSRPKPTRAPPPTPRPRPKLPPPELPPRPVNENVEPSIASTTTKPKRKQNPLNQQRPLPTPPVKQAICEKPAPEKKETSDNPSSDNLSKETLPPPPPPTPVLPPTPTANESQPLRSQPQSLLEQLRNPDPFKRLKPLKKSTDDVPADSADKPKKNELHNLMNGAINKRQGLLNNVLDEREEKKNQEFLINNPEFANANSSDWD